MNSTGTASLFEQVASGQMTADHAADVLMERRSHSSMGDRLLALPKWARVIAIVGLAILMMPLRNRGRSA